MPCPSHHTARLHQAVTYIEAHLYEDLTLEELAQISCFSRFHFHRIFTAFTGETVYAYIRRLRIERAALKLSQRQRTVTEIALQSGYETPAAFTKAFKQVLGLTPRQYQATRFQVEQHFSWNLTQPPEEQLMIKPTIQTLIEQRVLFVRKTGYYEKSVPEAWKELLEFAKRKQLPCDDNQLLGLVHDDDRITEQEKLRFDACILAPSHIKPEGVIASQTIQGGLYAIFRHCGSHKTIHETYRQIYGVWYPKSGVTLRDLPCFSKRLNSEVLPHNPEALITEIYVPIE